MDKTEQLLYKYTTYIFDFDYTLADSSKGILKCFHIVLTRNNYSGISDDQIKRTIGMTLENAFAQLTGEADKDLLSGLKAEYIKEADVIMAANTFIYKEALQLVKQIKACGGKTGIVSTKQGYVIKQTLDEYAVSSLFDIVIGSLDVKKAKPDPEGLLLAMKRLGSSTEETAYFGDSIIDSKTAQAASVDFIGVTTGATTKEELAEYPSLKIVSDLSNIL